MTQLIKWKVPDLPIMATGGIGGKKGTTQIMELRDNGAILFGTATEHIKDQYWVPKSIYQLAKRN